MLEMTFHQKVFTFLESYRKTHPEFLFCTRERNTKGRLDDGYWFQGTENYAFVGLYDRSGGSTMTRSIGLVFSQNQEEKISLGFQIAFNEEKDNKLLIFYNDLIKTFGEFKQVTATRFDKILAEDQAFEEAEKFLNEKKPIIDQKIRDAGLDEIFIDQQKFEKNLTNIREYQNRLDSKGNQKTFILANITWNSKDWKGESEDPSAHSWVDEGGVPHESWNFDFDNPKNSETEIFGYSKFTNPPKVEGDNNLIIFYSQNKIVGFYGKAQILKPLDAFNDDNLIGYRSLSIGLKYKIENVKGKGYLEDKKRVGRIGFNYLEREDTVNQILEEALVLNPEQASTIIAIRQWLGVNPVSEPNYWIFQGNPKVYNFHGSIAVNALKSWTVTSHKKKIKIGDKLIIWLVGKEPGCYALATVSSNLFFRTDDQAEYYSHSEGPGEGDAVRIIIDHNLSQSPILWPTLKDLPEFSSFNAGTQGTNFTATKEQYLTILKLINMANSEETPLNQIFFGPPGTGKTYHTIDEAVKIVSPNLYKEIQNDRDKLREEYKKKFIVDWEASTGQIGFCTFHQSFSYEDFVEGIKPLDFVEGDTYLKYETQEGVFKRISRLAEDSLKARSKTKESLFSFPQVEFDQAFFFKISLGEANVLADQEIYDYCMDEGLISIGSGSEIDLTDKNETEVSEIYNEKYKNSGAQFLNYFKNYLKVGNYVLVSRGNYYVRALGKVTGDYFYDAAAPIRYKHFRKVDWIFKDQDIPVQEIYEKNLSQQSIYKLKKEWIKPHFFVQKAADEIDIDSRDLKNYVLIIDEINRGNVASIFGELITLIEKSKRAGTKEAMEVVLPYSKEKFSVPSNLHIIGTMNTADRSIEALDTALRRRFSFREMPSIPDLLRTQGEIGKVKKGVIDGFDVVLILQKINERIEKLIDKDHKIGHAYFMEDTSLEDLKRTFRYKVIPLLEEYFFGDFGKIGLVLGSSFIQADQMKDFDFAEFKEYDANLISDLKQRKVYKIRSEEFWDFNAIYSPII
jgi:5-methylcytosine-specific restriction endonuclease McrBC GTP-binding regulatory subunit McrB